MRTPSVTVATVTALALMVALHATPAHAAGASPKQTEIVTIGASARPDLQPADPRAPALRRVASPRGAAAATATAVSAPVGSKPESFTTSLPFDAASLDAAQRAKLAAVRALAVAARVAEPAADRKPENLITVLPAVPGAGTPSLETLARLKQASNPVRSAAMAETRARGVTSVLGVIPRPEWSAGAPAGKPKDVATIGGAAPGATALPEPSANELQRRAAATTKASTPAAVKAHEVTTSLPRDPSLPAALAAKPVTPSTATPEVQP